MISPLPVVRAVGSFVYRQVLVTEQHFDALITHPALQRVLQEQGFSQPTQVQQEAIPLALGGENILVSSKTGSGKTAAFLLPAIQQLLERKPAAATGTRMLVLTPTRELARQILKIAEGFVRYTSLKVGMIAGGEELKYQKALLRKDPEILIATPGRLAEHVAHRSVDLSVLDVLVLDEADRMFDMGLSEDVLKIAASCPAQRQNLLFSATLELTGLKHLLKQVLQEQPFKRLDIQESANRIQQQILLADDIKHKERLLVALLADSDNRKVVVFTNTKLKAGQLDGLLRYHKHQVSALHGDMTQDERKRSLDLFRQGRTRILVATDVAARGLDVEEIDLVINFDMAHSGDEYTHRIGRTGRADREGRAVSLIASSEWNLMNGIERYLGVRFEKITLPGLVGKYQGPVKLKSSGKAATTRKKKPDSERSGTAKGKAQPKVKVRERDKKNIGKRRVPGDKAGEAAPAAVIDGFAPLKRKSTRNLPIDED